jgi:phage baseplate assembly protein W
MSQIGNAFALRDFSLTDDRTVSLKGDYLTVDWLEALRQRLYRRMMCSQGSIYHRPTIGAGLKDYLNRVIGAREAREIKARVRAQALLEPLIRSVEQIDVEAGENNSLLVTIYCTAANREIRLPLALR